MMFLLRSAFWLCLAYMVIKPGVDLASMGSDLSRTAVAAGRDVVAHGVEQVTCTSIQCIGGKALLSGVLGAPGQPPSPVQISEPSTAPLAGSVPLPRPRPRPS